MSDRQFLETDEILGLAETDLEYAEWQKSNSFPDTDWTDIQASRAAVADWTTQAFDALGDAGVVIDIPTRDGHSAVARVFVSEPSTAEPKSPLVVLLHGGAFVTGDPRELAQYAIALRELYGATVVMPSYRLAPEHPFPQAQHDVWDVLVWLADNAGSTWGVDLSDGFIVGGVSAGANLAATACQKWCEEGREPKLTGLWLSMPFVIPSVRDVPTEYRYAYLSRTQNATAPMNGEIPPLMVEALEPDPTSPLYSPFRSTDPHAPLARAGVRVYLQASGQDAYRDDALIYERVLCGHGVDTKLSVYRGLPHAHFALLPFLDASKRCNVDTLQQFGWLLDRDLATEETARFLMHRLNLE